MALVRVPFYFINLLPTSLLYISILLNPNRVLKAKNIPHHDLQDAHTIQALFEAGLPYVPETVASDTDASGTDPSLIDSQASDASDD